jgi:hypothetical protein
VVIIYRMVRDRTRAAAHAGEVMRGEFTPANSGLVAAGTLTWSQDDGARLELIGDTQGWPSDFGSRHVIHGVIDGGDDVTLVDAMARSVALGDQPTTFSALTLALGAHVDEATRWERAIYSTTNLAEWIGDTGLETVHPDAPDDPRGMLWRRPMPIELRLPRAAAMLSGFAHFDPSGPPSWSVTTGQQLVVNLRRRATASDLHSRYAIPLVSLTAFAADRPDSVTEEILLNPGTTERVELLRSGPRFAPAARPRRGFLFLAKERSSVSAMLTRWWKLHTEIWPALGVFADHIVQGSTYSSPRFLTLHAAMEGYCRARFGKKDFRLMRDYAAVDISAHGCTNRTLALVGATRDYFSHLNTNNYSHADIEAAILDTTRHAHALMQTCLLRELGFGPRQTEQLMHRHHRNWPLPSASSS